MLRNQFVRSGDEEPRFTRVRLDFSDDGSLAYVNERMIGRVGLIADAAANAMSNPS